MLPIGNEKLGILDIKKVSNLDREIAIPIDFFYAHLYSCHNNSPELFIKNADVFFLQQHQEVILTLLKKLFKKNLFKFTGIFYPSGEPILLHLLCCDPFAVENHSSMDHASHLQQPRLVNNPVFSGFPLILLIFIFFETLFFPTRL